MPYKDSIAEKAAHKRWRQSERGKAYAKRYRQTASYKASQRRYYESGKKQLHNKIYERSILGKISDIKKSFAFRQRLRLGMIELLGGKCIQCGFTDTRALHIDHINNDGYIDKQRFRRDDLKQWMYYRDHPDEAKIRLQILCGNHHSIKTFDYVIQEYNMRIELLRTKVVEERSMKQTITVKN